MTSAQQIFSLIDLTSLNDNDDTLSIDNICKKAIKNKNHVAAICVYPQFVKQVVKYVNQLPIKVATVVNFPEGTQDASKVISDIQTAINHGANEIDIVFPYQDYLAGKSESALSLISRCKLICGKNILVKVILETGVINDILLIKEISQKALIAGADFLKTSTGKVAVGATLEATEAMLAVIKEQTTKLNRPLGLKVSGGVRAQEQALQYIEQAKNIMGRDWVTPLHFRLGASQLIDTLNLE